jgi:putative oxidoreductase
MNILKLPSLLEDQISKRANLIQSLFLLTFRLYWGWQFFVNGKGKLINHVDVTSFFASLHIPAPALNAWLVGGAECFGGLLLMAGLFSRSAGLVLSIVMTTAYLAVSDDRAKLLNLFSDPAPFLNADPFFFLLTAVLVFAFGSGAISIDSVLSGLFERRSRKLLHTKESASSGPSKAVLSV